MAEGYTPDFPKTLDTNFSSGYSTNQHDDEVITQPAAAVSPSLIDFSRMSTASTKAYTPGKSFEPSSFQPSKDLAGLSNGGIKETETQKDWKSGINGGVRYSKETQEVIFHEKYVGENDKDEKDKPRTEIRNRYIETAKIVVVLVCVALGVVAVVVLTTKYDKVPEVQRLVTTKEFYCFMDSNSAVSTIKIRFNATIVITCAYSFDSGINIKNATLFVQFKPTYNLIQIHDSIEVNQTLHSDTIRQGRWEIRLQSKKIEIRGDPVKCGSDGTYEISLRTSKENYTHQVKVEIESETSAVQLEVGQREENGQYLITCSSKSECAPAPITLLGTVGNKIIPLYGVNFTCTINYNDNDGWSASCEGSIPKSVVSAIDEITCRPVLKNQTEANYTEAKVSKDVLLCNNDADCTFRCPQENQDRYYTDPRSCNIFHRCVDNRLYTAPCGKGTYFSTKTCACSHINDVIQDDSCNASGERLAAGNKKILCDDTNL